VVNIGDPQEWYLAVMHPLLTVLNRQPATLPAEAVILEVSMNSVRSLLNDKGKKRAELQPAAEIRSIALDIRTPELSSDGPGAVTVY
jgi:hypothetical protein